MKTLFILSFFFFLSINAKTTDYISSIIRKYDRPTTIIDLSKSENSKFTHLAEQHPAHVFIGPKEPSHHDYPKNCLVIDLPVSTSNLKILPSKEHFDIAYFCGNLREMDSRIEYLNLASKLADHCIFELELAFSERLNEFLSRINAIHVCLSDSKRHNVYYIKNQEKRVVAPWLFSTPHTIKSNFHYKLTSQNLPRPQGISLMSFRLLNGLYPSTEQLEKQLRNSKWQHAVTLPSCALLDGEQVKWMRVPNSHKIWPEEGLKSCIHGLNIPHDDYEPYCKQELRRLCLPL